MIQSTYGSVETDMIAVPCTIFQVISPTDRTRGVAGSIAQRMALGKRAIGAIEDSDPATPITNRLPGEVGSAHHPSAKTGLRDSSGDKLGNENANFGSLGEKMAKNPYSLNMRKGHKAKMRAFDPGSVRCSI